MEQMGSEDGWWPAVVPVLAAATVAALLGGVMVWAFHAPSPHGLELAVVGSPPAVGQMAEGLDVGVPDVFEVGSLPSRATAVAALGSRAVDGAIVLGDGEVEVLVASAAGPAAAAVVEGAGTGLAAQRGVAVRTADVAPLPAGDARGSSAFFLVLATTIPSVAFALVLAVTRPGLGWRRRLHSLARYAGLVGVDQPRHRPRHRRRRGVHPHGSGAGAPRRRRRGHGHGPHVLAWGRPGRRHRRRPAHPLGAPGHRRTRRDCPAPRCPSDQRHGAALQRRPGSGPTSPLLPAGRGRGPRVAAGRMGVHRGPGRGRRWRSAPPR